MIHPDRQTYDSDPFSCDFNAALANARTPKRKRAEDPQAAAERAYMRRFSSGDFALEDAPAVSVMPTGDDFRRHAQRFGSECVAETARELGGMTVTAQAAPKSGAKRQRRTTPNVREQVLSLHGRGIVPAAIADTLNLSDRRVREILKAA